MRGVIFLSLILLSAEGWAFESQAATSIPLTVSLSEAVTVTGTPRVAVDVGGQTRYASYTSGSGSSALTFTLSPQAGDVDLDGITVSSPIDLNGGTIKDIGGNNLVSLAFTPPNTSGIKVNYPSFGMDFVYDADGRYTLNGIVYNDLTSFLTATGGTFSRTSTGTYYDSAGTLQTASAGSPRFDYDPVTLAPKGLLVEESRTNLAKNSENFSAWNNNVSLTFGADAMVAPNGTMTADTTNATGSTRYTVASVTAGTKYTYSIFVKPLDPTKQIMLYVDGTAGLGYCRIVPSTGAVAIQTGTYNYAGVMALSNGWYRVYMVFTPTTTGNQAVHVYPVNTDLTGWWGAQLEAGAFPTSYIQTTTATVTRAADNLYFPTSSWYNGTEGSMLVSVIDPRPTITSAGIWAGLGTPSTINDRLQLYGSGSNAVVQNYVGGASQLQSTVAARAVGANKLALAFADNNFAYAYNGGAASSQLTGTLGTKTRLVLGRGADYSSEYIDGTLKQFKYYPLRISSSQLSLLTQ